MWTLSDCCQYHRCSSNITRQAEFSEYGGKKCIEKVSLSKYILTQVPVDRSGLFYTNTKISSLYLFIYLFRKAVEQKKIVGLSHCVLAENIRQTAMPSETDEKKMLLVKAVYWWICFTLGLSDCLLGYCSLSTDVTSVNLSVWLRYSSK